MRLAITGGCGFLGTNLARHMYEKAEITLIDNLSRPGSRKNRNVLRNYQDIRILECDVRTYQDWKDHDAIVHLAGQVTVTGSLDDPVTDLEENAVQTLRILQDIKYTGIRFILASTNKVYPSYPQTTPTDIEHRVGPECPYGISKTAADLYTQLYSRLGVSTVVLRQSCIYGPWQRPMLGQGWVSWFIERIMGREMLTVFGDGRQQRDVLYVDDWCELMEVILGVDVGGRVFNVGGGVRQVINLLDMIKVIEDVTGLTANWRFGDARMGDQPTYISDLRHIKNELGWEPTVGVYDGVRRTVEWMKKSL